MKIPTKDEIDQLCELAKVMVSSGLYRRSCETISQAVTLMLLGMDYGLSPVSALSQINVISGKPTLSAGAQAALVKRGGKYTWKVERIDDEVCELIFMQATPDGWMVLGPSSFSFKEAQAAGIAKGHGWRNYRQDMVFARALSRGCRRYAADQFGGTVYSEDELEDTPAPPPTTPESTPEDDLGERLDVRRAALYALKLEAFDTIEEAVASAEELDAADMPLERKRQVWKRICEDRRRLRGASE